MTDKNNNDLIIAEQRVAELVKEIDDFRESVKPKLENVINAYLSMCSISDITDRRKIAELIHTSSKKLGMALEFRGQQCSIYATHHPKKPTGHFMLTPKGSSHPLSEPSNLSSILPLKFMYSLPPSVPEFPRHPMLSDPSSLPIQSNSSEWQAKVKLPREPKKRG